jgi:hypothetical protein
LVTNLVTNVSPCLVITKFVTEFVTKLHWAHIWSVMLKPPCRNYKLHKKNSRRADTVKLCWATFVILPTFMILTEYFMTWNVLSSYISFNLLSVCITFTADMNSASELRVLYF